MAASSSGLPQAAPSPPAAASTKGLVRVEHKYTERHVRVCLKAALDQHSVGIIAANVRRRVLRVVASNVSVQVGLQPPADVQLTTRRVVGVDDEHPLVHGVCVCVCVYV